jgi:hypothetical protein
LWARSAPPGKDFHAGRRAFPVGLVFNTFTHRCAHNPGSPMTERTIPALPCISLDEAITFYELLGFEATYRQKSPNPYGVIRRGGCELHLFGLEGLKPEEGYSVCIVVVEDVESLHQVFAEGLRRGYRKLPISGFPRITRMREGQGRFTLTDPSGNSVIFVKREAHSSTGERKSAERGNSRLALAIETAATFRDSSGDDESAAKVLDVALARYADAPAAERARALAARAELAVALKEPERLAGVRAELLNVPLSDEERERLRDELQAADRLEQLLGEEH